MRKFFLPAVVLLLATAPIARADTFSFNFGGGTVSGSATLTYGPATDATYSQAYKITGASGTVSDSAIGLSNVAITGVYAISPATPEPGNLLTPSDFSRYPVAAGTQHGSLSYDNLFWPTGSPQTATSYPPHGGFTDIYGILFTLANNPTGNNEVLDFWSNGVLAGTAPDYGVIVSTPALALDTIDGGVTVTPEPAPFALLATGLVGALLWRRP